MEHTSNYAPAINSFRHRVLDMQSSRRGRYIIFKHDPTGLGAQISRRILAIRVGMLTGRTVLFPDEDFYPYENAFEPIGPDLELPSDIPNLDFTRLLDDPREFVAFDFWSFWKDEELKSMVYSEVPPEFQPSLRAVTLLEGAIFSMFQLREEYRSAVDDALSGLPRQPIVGVHFRRGDKFVETPYVPATAYRDAVHEVCTKYGIENVIISSDSPIAPQQLRLDRHLNVIFDYNEKRYNNANHRFLMKNRNLAAQETLTAIRNVYLLGNSEKVVGQTNAHFATLAAGQIAARTGSDDIGILMEPKMLPTRLDQKLGYIAYKQLRSTLKIFLPHLTLKRGSEQ